MRKRKEMGPLQAEKSKKKKPFCKRETRRRAALGKTKEGGDQLTLGYPYRIQSQVGKKENRNQMRLK